jgi:hypothetical protein
VLQESDWEITRVVHADIHLAHSRVFKKYSQMKLKMQREALEKINREANEMTMQTATPVPETGGSGTAPAQL